MKKLLIALGCVMMVTSSVSALSLKPNAFSDVSKNDSNFEAIAWLEDNGVIEGYEDGTFKPDVTINRAEFLKMVYEADPAFVSSAGDEKACVDIGYDGPGGNPDPAACDYKPFSDVKASAWYNDYVLQAKMEGIVEGYGDGTFRPDKPISYAEAVKIIVEKFFWDPEYGDGECDNSEFYNEAREGDDDKLDKDAWYYHYVKFTDSVCISDFGSAAIGVWGYLAVDQPIERGDMAELIYRAKAVRDDNNQPFSGQNSVPKILKYCRDSYVITLDNGRDEYPMAPEYNHLGFLGQIFTSYEYCGRESVGRLFGVEQGDGMAGFFDYSLGSTLNLEAGGPSDDLEDVLGDIGYVCDTDALPCEEYELSKEVSIEDIMKLEPYVDEMESDDCVNCG